MSKDKEFEQLIERIYKLLVNNGGEVKWNDKIPDPDNPTQNRQIDITIKKDNLITHIECRIHKEPQDVKWVEELIGRQISLQADMVIAVSNSGFTKGAVLKANKYGIAVRDLKQLSEAEIEEWGKRTKLRLTYYGFKNIGLRLLFKNHQNLNLSTVVNELQEKSNFIDALFNTLKYYLNQQQNFNYPLSIFYNLEAHNMILCDKNLEGIKIRTEIHTFEVELDIPVVSVYGHPKTNHLNRMVTIEKSDNYELEIIKSNNLLSLVLNLSKLPQAPANSVIAGIIKINCNQSVTVPKVNFIGTQEQKMYLYDTEFGLMEFENV
ncbi:MAG: restriction endonuclease [Methylococcales bacterium]|nr:restriction endonuclease [Methylococcales bacterium]